MLREAPQGIVKDIDHHRLARNMGTSVKVIEDCYGKHISHVQSAAKLSGRIQRNENLF